MWTFFYCHQGLQWNDISVGGTDKIVTMQVATYLLLNRQSHRNQYS